MSVLVLILVVSGCKDLLSGEGLSGFPKMAILIHKIDSNLNCLSKEFENISAKLESSLGFSVTRSSKGENKWESFYLRLVARDAQSEPVVNFGRNDH